MNKDKKDGYHEYFHENRNLKARGHYVDGMKTGEWQYFDEEGNYSHGYVALGKQSGQILDDLKKHESEAKEPQEEERKYFGLLEGYLYIVLFLIGITIFMYILKYLGDLILPLISTSSG